MNQLSFFETPEQRMYQQLLPRLEEVLDKNWADKSLLSLEERQSYHSVVFDGSVVVRLRAGKKPYIELPDNGQKIPGGRKNDKYIRIPLEDLRYAEEYLVYINNTLQNIIDAIPKEFSCCSKYMECSDRFCCTNSNKDMAMRCGYRKILMGGQVFYGTNRNID